MIRIMSWSSREKMSTSISKLKSMVSIRLSHMKPTTSSYPLGIDNSIENNLITETNKLNKTKLKFWKDVSLNESINPNMIYIQLDSKTIKTPLGNHLAVEKERKLLAYLLKKEWENVPNSSIKPFSLPLTSLVSRCIDLEMVNNKDGGLDLNNLTAKIGGDRTKISEDLLRYLDTDTLLVFSPRKEFEGALRKEQDKLYLPIIQSSESYFDKFYSPPNDKTKLKLKILDADIHGIRSNLQDKKIKDAAMNYLSTLSHWNLAVFEKIVTATKSFICGLLLIQDNCENQKIIEGNYNVENIVKLATLETIFQTDRWGEVEDTHDVNKCDIKRNVAASSIVATKLK